MIDGGGSVLYASTEAHSTVFRAASLLGLGHAAVHTVPVDASYRMRVDALEEAVALGGPWQAQVEDSLKEARRRLPPQSP